MPVSPRGPVLVAVLMLTRCPPPCTCELQQDVGVLQVVKSDRVFSQGLLWTVCRTSVVRCAAACLKDPLCACFTFTRNSTGQTRCRGHSREPSTEGEWSPGSRLYLLTSRSALSSLTTQQEPVTTVLSSLSTQQEPVITVLSSLTTQQEPVTTALSNLTTQQEPVTTALSSLTTQQEPVTTSQSSLTTQQEPATTTADSIITTTGNTDWVNKTCTDNSECVDVTNAECFKGLCMCTPGYYYSLTTGLCLSNCPAPNLQNAFLAYPGYVIVGYTLPGLPQEMSVSDCLDLCVTSSATCPSVSITDNFFGTWCSASHKSRLDVPERWLPFNGATYYQRTCL